MSKSISAKLDPAVVRAWGLLHAAGNGYRAVPDGQNDSLAKRLYVLANRAYLDAVDAADAAVTDYQKRHTGGAGARREKRESP